MSCDRLGIITTSCFVAGLCGCSRSGDGPAASPASPGATTASAEVRQHHSIRGVSIEIERQPGGKKYPVYVKESYELPRDGSLRYFAYFGGMPTNMNHTDSITWKAGAHGQKVMAVIEAIVGDPALFATLELIPDEGVSPCRYGAYSIGLTRQQADLSYCLKDPRSRAFTTLDRAFTALIDAFERSARRPLTPAALPQAR